MLSVFQRLNADQDLYALVFGESVLNDAVAITLYRTFLSFLVRVILYCKEKIVSYMWDVQHVPLACCISHVHLSVVVVVMVACRGVAQVFAQGLWCKRSHSLLMSLCALAGQAGDAGGPVCRLQDLLLDVHWLHDDW